MTSERKFYKTIIEVEVLSEDPYDPNTLKQVAYDIIEGDCSGAWSVKSREELDGKQAADALVAQGSEPGFFRLTEEGEDEE